MARLQNVKHELFCQHIANGKPLSRAYVLAGYKTGDNTGNSVRLFRHLKASHSIQRRVGQIMETKLKALDLSRDDILNFVLSEYELASESGQHAPALKALEMLGKEQFHMFTDRKEHININISNMSRTQLESYVLDRFGEVKGRVLLGILNTESPTETISPPRLSLVAQST